MGKGKRVRTQNAEERKAKKDAAIKKAAKERMYHRLTVCISVVLVAALLLGFIWFAFLKDYLASRSMHNAITMKTENREISAAQFNYFYTNTYMNYATYAQYYQLNTELPLKDQPYTNSEIEGYSWHDKIVDDTKTAVRELLVLCEVANARNITLTEDEIKNIDASIETLKSTAQQQNMSFKKFVENYYGIYITEDDIRECMEMQTLAGKAADVVLNEPTYSDEQLKNELENNVEMYNFVDYRSIKISATYATTASKDEIAKAKEEAKAKAEAILNASTSEEEFEKAAEAYYRELYNVVADEEAKKATDANSTDKREKITEAELTTKMDATTTKGHAYSTSTDIGKWLFEQNKDGEYIRKAGEVKLITDESNGTYTVYYLTKPMYIHDYATRNVRHILITVDSYDKENGLPDAEAKAEAERILKEWQDGEKTEDSFGKLANEYTKDTGSATNGGLYENVAQGDMAAEFDKWLFDATEKGATEIVKTTFGYHIMYYVGESDTLKWEADAESNLRNADYDVAYKKFTEQYAVTIDEDAFKKVKQAGT